MVISFLSVSMGYQTSWNLQAFSCILDTMPNRILQHDHRPFEELGHFFLTRADRINPWVDEKDRRPRLDPFEFCQAVSINAV